MAKPRIIALYLPQYHPTPDNDKWWGKGFTEWTNVGKAKPLFRGHYQPKVPADLGYYDLRLPIIREQQAELAREAGIEGFCYYHYWFGNGKEELELPFNEVLSSGKPDFPFMLCWANESWSKKFWNKDGSIDKTLLIEQTYPGIDDIKAHFYRLLPAFKDKRYLTKDGKPMFMIYYPFSLPNPEQFIEIWQDLAKREGLNGIHFIASLWLDISECSINRLRRIGFDAVNTLGLWRASKLAQSTAKRVWDKFKSVAFNIARVKDYSKVSALMFNQLDAREDVYPSIVPNWDHSPRSGGKSLILTDSTPKKFKIQASELFDITKSKDENIIFVKSWNEWGEGNYMEPDLVFGHGYIEALKDAINAISD